MKECKCGKDYYRPGSGKNITKPLTPKTKKHEDEKYSYIAISKEPLQIDGNRILRHPHTYKGMIEVEVCNTQGIKKEQIRKNHPNYKVIKHLDSNDKISH